MSFFLQCFPIPPGLTQNGHRCSITKRDAEFQIELGMNDLDMQSQELLVVLKVSNCGRLDIV